MEALYEYNWDDAVNDGTFVNVSDMAKEAGIRFPTAVTSNLYHTYINPDPMPSHQDEKGRLWDVLHMFKLAARKTADHFLTFKVIFANGDITKTVELWAVCEARSSKNPEPIVTIMLPEDH